ncbi:unnamed protein product [Fusarium graminearum]|nr:unnamed protein product [Fusarium graminearum]
MIVNASPYSCHIGRERYIKTRLIAGVLGTERSELFESFPDCTSPCLDLYSDSISNITDPCNDKNLNNGINNCIARQCSDFERFEVAKAYANACAVKTEDNRFDHYILLLAEVPAWTFVWLRLYLSWVTYERLALDDYVMMVCGLIYTAFIPLVHLLNDQHTPQPTAQLFGTRSPGQSQTPLNHHMIATGTTIVFTFASSVVLVLLRVFRCSPIAFSWEAWALDENEKEMGGCLPQDSLAYAASAIDIFLNIIIFATMISLVLSRFPRGMMSWLSHAFAVFLGAFALAISGLRAQLLVDFFTKMQPVWKYHERLIWMDVEIAILILWSCSPAWQFFADSDSGDSEVQNQSTLLITSTDSTKKRATKLQSTKTAIRSTGFLGMLTRSRTKKPFSSTLHLGDKTYGNVRTEIQGGQRFSMISQFTGLIGIQVKTRTVRRVEDNEWDPEKGVARENIKADDE